jgi:hypothetical protein
MTALDEIKKALEGVTPGPWFMSGVRFRMNGSVWHSVNRYDEPLKRDEGIACVGFDERTGAGLSEAKYIAAVNPAAISELLSTLESLQRENEELRKERDHVAAEKSGLAKNAHSNVDYWKSQFEAAEAEVKRLQAEIDRKSSMPGDHRYWEGRYRDEATENEKLRGVVERAQSIVSTSIYPSWHDTARAALASTGGEHHAE